MVEAIGKEHGDSRLRVNSPEGSGREEFSADQKWLEGRRMATDE